MRPFRSTYGAISRRTVPSRHSSQWITVLAPGDGDDAARAVGEEYVYPLEVDLLADLMDK